MNTDMTITNANCVVRDTAVDYIEDMAKQEHLSDEKADEVLDAAQKAIDTSFELLNAWSELDGDRTFSFAVDRTFIIDPISKRDDSPLYTINFFINLWPFGCGYRNGEPPNSKTIGVYFTPRNFAQVELWNAIVNDVLAAIKVAEELITQANKKED